MDKLFEKVLKESNRIIDEYKKLDGKIELKDLCKKAELTGMLQAFNLVLKMIKS